MTPRLLMGLVAVLILAGCQTATPPAAKSEDARTTAAPAAPVAPAVTAPAAPVPVATIDPFWPRDGVFPVPGRTSSWSGFRANNLQRRTAFAQQREHDQDGIVFVGDSITEGWRMLDVDFAGLGIKVVNRGIGGDTTPNLIYRLEEDVLSLHPRGLVILIGTNDLGEHTTPEQIAANLRELHGRVRAAYPTIPIAWCLVMPRGDGHDFADRIRELNARIAQLAGGDPRATVCDTFTPLALPSGAAKPEAFVPDRLHLNSGGYAAWRAVIYPVLEGWGLGQQR